MATANIDLADGTKIVIDGTPDEIVKILALYRHLPEGAGAKAFSGSAISKLGVVAPDRRIARRSREGAMSYIRDLIEESFFAQNRSIADVQSKLEEMGHIYPQTHLSTPLRRLVRSRELRRLREGRNWVYSQWDQ